MGAFGLGAGGLGLTRRSGAVIRPNLFTFPVSFENGDWTKLGGLTVTNDIAVAPDGNTTADRINGGTSDPLVRQQKTHLAQPYTMTIHAKPGTFSRLLFNIEGCDSGGAFPTFDVTTGLWVANGNAGVTRWSTALANGWYRAGITYKPAAGFGGADFGFAQSNGHLDGSFLGTETMFWWGAKLEAGPAPSAFVLP